MASPADTTIANLTAHSSVAAALPSLSARVGGMSAVPRRQPSVRRDALTAWQPRHADG